MNPYYKSLTEDIEALMGSGRYKEAKRIIQEELSVPYVERDAEQALRRMDDMCSLHIEETVEGKNFELSKLIEGNELQKEKAVSLLLEMNLRKAHSEVQKLLDSSLLEEFKGELIEALMEQKIDDPYHIVKDGLDITFVPSTILPARNDPSVQEARQLIDTWFMSSNPSLYNFCMRLLEQEIYEIRPFDLSEIDGLVLAKSIVRLVYEAMQQEEELDRFLKANGLEQTADYTLAIEKRGDNHEM